jgi:hypothetical protein
MKMTIAFSMMCCVCGCEHELAPANRVPETRASIKIDGDWEESDWVHTALRRQLDGPDGALARPSSEVRLLRQSGELLLALYAADENIESSDAFNITVGTLALHVTAPGKVTPAAAGVRAATGFDEGTLDNPADDDEEWVAEVAITATTLGLHEGETIPVTVARCDTPKDGVRRCGSWKGTVTW